MSSEDPVATRTLTCDHVCPSTSANVALALFSAIARAVVYQSSILSSSASRAKQAGLYARELEDILERTSGKKLSDLLNAINAWTASKRGLMSEIFGSAGAAQVQMENELESADVWPEGARHALALKLVRDHYDIDHQAHCSTSFENEEALFQHKLECSFRPMSCQNEGCIATFSLNQQSKHDSKCAFKMVPCKLECGQLVMRKEMTEHTTGPCEMREVVCPYSSLGCSCPVRQRLMPAHLVENQDNHLRMLYAETSKTSIRVDEVEKWAADVVANDERRREGVRAIDASLLALETKHLDLDKDHTATKSQQIKLEGRVKDLESTTKSQNNKLEARVKELESLVKQQAAELAAQRKTLDGIMKTFSSIAKR